jgi:hypothetical protein
MKMNRLYCQGLTEIIFVMIIKKMPGIDSDARQMNEESRKKYLKTEQRLADALPLW